MKYFRIVFVVAIVLILILGLVNADRTRRKNETTSAKLERLEQRVKNTCAQASATLTHVAALLQRNEIDRAEAREAMSYSASSIWLCTGAWPEPGESVDQIVRKMRGEIDPDKTPVP